MGMLSAGDDIPMGWQDGSWIYYENHQPKRREKDRYYHGRIGKIDFQGYYDDSS
jgi:hypothetical protein